VDLDQVVACLAEAQAVADSAQAVAAVVEDPVLEVPVLVVILLRMIPVSDQGVNGEAEERILPRVPRHRPRRLGRTPTRIPIHRCKKKPTRKLSNRGLVHLQRKQALQHQEHHQVHRRVHRAIVRLKASKGSGVHGQCPTGPIGCNCWSMAR
jgi:hypothetical protein